jgi:tetratricopeptide (TPR) repeat protein
MVSRSGPRRGSGGTGARLGAGVFVALVVVAALFFIWRAIGERGQGAPATGAPTGGGRPGSGDAATYAREGRAAEARHDDDAALATYREGLRRYPDDAVLLGSYATAIKNRSFAVRPSRGRMVPVAATSHDRVRAAREALALLEAAQRARPAGSQAPLQKGLLYAAWGLPEDALVELYAAVTRGDRSPELEQTAGAITLLQLGRGNEVDQNGMPASR